MCDSGKVEVVDHFLINFGKTQKALLEKLRGFEGLENGWRSLRGWALRGSGIVVGKGN